MLKRIDQLLTVTVRGRTTPARTCPSDCINRPEEPNAYLMTSSFLEWGIEEANDDDDNSVVDYEGKGQ